MLYSSPGPKKLPLIPVQFDDFARVQINGRYYSQPKFPGDQCILIREDSGLAETFSQAEIKALADSRKLRLEAHFYDPVQAVTAASTLKVLFRNLPPEQQDRALYRQGYCDHILKEEAHHNCRRSGHTFEKAIDDHFIALYRNLSVGKKGRADTTLILPKKPSSYQVSRWLERYEESGFDPLSLADRRSFGSGNFTPRLEPETRRLLKDAGAAWISQGRPKVTGVFEDTFKPSLDTENERRAEEGKEILARPNIKALHRVIKKLNKFHVMAGRNTVEYAKKKLTLTDKGTKVRYPLQRVLMDEWKTPLQTLLEKAGVYEQLSDKEKAAVKRVRVWVTVAVCAATRCILSCVFHVGSPNTQSALQALKLIFQDKTAIGRELGTISTWGYYGRAFCIAFDNGSALSSAPYHRAIVSMRCRFDHTPPGEPQLRGHIESVFHKIEMRLMPHFTGRTFHGPEDRRGYDSEANASLTVEELLRVMVIYLVDVYHHEPHEMLMGETPFNAWNRLSKIWGVDTIIDPSELRHVFGMKRRGAITSDGIEFLGLHYQSEQLQRDRFKYNLDDADFQVDTDDLGEISVVLPKGAISVPCIHEEAAGLTLEQWVKVKSDTREKHDREAELSWPIVRHGIEHIKAISANAVQRSKLEPLIWSEEALDKVEADFLRTFRISKRPDPAQHGLFGNVIELDADSDEPEDSTEDKYVDEEVKETPRKVRKSVAKRTATRNAEPKPQEIAPPETPMTVFKKWETED